MVVKFRILNTDEGEGYLFVVVVQKVGWVAVAVNICTAT